MGHTSIAIGTAPYFFIWGYVPPWPTLFCCPYSQFFLGLTATSTLYFPLMWDLPVCKTILVVSFYFIFSQLTIKTLLLKVLLIIYAHMRNRDMLWHYTVSVQHTGMLWHYTVSVQHTYMLWHYTVSVQHIDIAIIIIIHTLKLLASLLSTHVK